MNAVHLSIKTQGLVAPGEDLSDEYSQGTPPGTTFKGWESATICFDDGSSWSIKNALSKGKYQQSVTPFEATQVFTCGCTKDPDHKYGADYEAIVKVKYQIKGTYETLHYYKDMVRQRAEAATLEHDSEKSIERLKESQDQLHAATNPVEEPNEFTVNEVRALEHFGRAKCNYTPELLSIALDTVRCGTGEVGMEGGYIVFILMTKLPGERITYDYYWKLSEYERDEIRTAFKEALIAVWRCGIDPQDCALRNILWDKKNRECYIVDFEDYYTFDLPNPEAHWNDTYLRDWKLTNECFWGWDR